MSCPSSCESSSPRSPRRDRSASPRSLPSSPESYTTGSPVSDRSSSMRSAFSTPRTPPTPSVALTPSPVAAGHSAGLSPNTRFRTVDYDDPAMYRPYKCMSYQTPPTSLGSEASSSPFLYRRIPFYLVPSYHSSDDTADSDIYEETDGGETNVFERAIDDIVERMATESKESVVTAQSETPVEEVPFIKRRTHMTGGECCEAGRVHSGSKSFAGKEFRDGIGQVEFEPLPKNDMPVEEVPFIKRRTHMTGGECCEVARAHVGSKTFAGKGLRDGSGMCRAEFEPWVEKNTSWRKGDESSIYGPHFDYHEPDFEYSDPERREQGFNPYVHTYALKKFASPYKDFRSANTSTPYNAPTPDKRTRNAWKYHSLVGEEEESFHKAATPPGLDVTMSPKHRHLNPPTAADDSATAKGINHVLGVMEFVEIRRISKDLRDFQKARRRLIFDATQIKPI